VYNVTVDGLWHGYMYITLIVSLAIMGYLALVAGMETLPFKLPASHAQLLLVATGLNFVLTFISFLTNRAARRGSTARTSASSPRSSPWLLVLFPPFRHA